MQPEFESLEKSDVGRGRTGRIHVPGRLEHPAVKTPAFFPVLNLMGGPTPVSGGIWSRLRNRLFGDDEFQGAMFQAMSFLDFNMTPEQVSRWRTEKDGLHAWFTGHDSPKNNPDPPSFTQPLFVDSGGFKLMNSRTFGDAPEEGGGENEWDIYTNPESILSLQRDYGADLIATLDYPIPPDLNAEEKDERVEDSIRSAIECVRLLQEDDRFADWNPVTYAAIHGHDSEDIAYYVQQLFERTDYPEEINGLAIGSLVPLRNGSMDQLVDIVQAATEAIPDEERDSLAIHMFGVGGKFAPLLAAMGVDSYDSTTYAQAANHKKFVLPDTFEKKKAADVNADDWHCDCPACEELTEVGIKDMKRVFATPKSEGYKPITVGEGDDSRTYMKSDFYALIAHHNFHTYQREVNAVREAIREGRLGEHVREAAEQNDELAKALARAASRWPELRKFLPAGVSVTEGSSDRSSNYIQMKIGADGDLVVPQTNAISLNHTPEDFDIRERHYNLADAGRVCLVIPCSEKKPYSESKTHKVVRNRLSTVWNEVHKVTVSGMYGPVPEPFETEPAVTTYDYVLTDADRDQIDLVTRRLVSYLDTHGGQFDAVIGYAASKTYRAVIGDAFDCAAVEATLLPRNPASQRLREHFRSTHLDELTETVGAKLVDATTD